MCICIPVYAAKKEKKSKTKEIEPEIIEYQAQDKFNIKADLYIPLQLPKDVKVPLIIMVHALSQDKSVWKPYAIDFVKKGYSVLAVDLRGHGQSIINKKGQKLFWRKFTGEDWKYIATDLTGAIDYLKLERPEVNVDKTLIIGSSMGTCVAIAAAEKEKKRVKGLVLLSPFTNYKGIEARVPLVNYGDHPVLMVASKSDTSSYQAAQELVKYSQGEHEIVLVKNAGHGTFMLKFEPRLEKIIFDWVEKRFPPTQEKLPAETKSKKSKKSSKGTSNH